MISDYWHYSFFLSLKIKLPEVGIHKYQNDKSVPLVPKIFNWPKTIKPTTLSSWFKVAGGRAMRASPLRGDNRL